MPVVPPPFSNLALKKARPEATYKRPRMGEGDLGRRTPWRVGIWYCTGMLRTPGNGLLTSGGASWPQP